MRTFALRAPEHSRVPLVRLSEPGKPTIHRFFDTSPVSPSGRYAALFELPHERDVPQPGEAGTVVVHDISSNKVLWRSPTIAWDTQLGAQVQWGSTDEELFFNRMNAGDWAPYGVCVNFLSGAERRYDRAIYMVNGVSRQALAPDLIRIAHVQPGYGVVVPPEHLPKNIGFPEDDGVWLIDIDSGSVDLIRSLSSIAEALPEHFERFRDRPGGLYTFHTKWNDQGTRLMAVLRWIEAGAERGPAASCLVTMRPDGSELAMAVDFAAWKGGHHPNWCPDGETIVMNLRDKSRRRSFARPKAFLQKATNKIGFLRRHGLRYFSNADMLHFIRFNHDGGEIEILAPKCTGTGHPSLSPDETYLISDAYLRERGSYGDGTVPIRKIDIGTGLETELVRIQSRPEVLGPRAALRVDPHPTWTSDGKGLVFNGIDGGVRQVFLAEMG
ncbi:hypothetical protein [Altericroceibacterium spongiae]|uniref:hypothetical protein n=1 Tax=Altericroceibacterium spongiae TaxID=2320269 RepID=UPI0015FF9258|nr:hypothetical protein [Altericroceibacterium spongiae]